MASLGMEQLKHCRAASTSRASIAEVVLPVRKPRLNTTTVRPIPRPGQRVERVSTYTFELSAERQLVTCSALAGTAVPAKPIPPSEEVKVDGVSTHEIIPGVQLLRGNCTARLKYEVEYILNRGTTDNSYVIRVPGAAVVVDVPFEAYAADYVTALGKLTPLAEVSHVIITQLDPKSIPSLEQLIAAAKRSRPAGAKQLEVVLSNPAARLLQSALGEKPEKADLLSSVTMSVARSGLKVPLGSGGEELEVTLMPTPRWPDLMTVYYPAKQLLFTSKLFSAHVAPSVATAEAEDAGAKKKPQAGANSALDVGGWEVYGNDWRHYFECMVAPQAKQAASALDKLDVIPTTLGGKRPSARGQDDTLYTEFGNWLYRLLSGKKNPTGAAAPAPLAAADSSQMLVGGLLPMHGPVVTTSLAQLTREYRLWLAEQIKAASTSSVAVLYASAYGNTAALAQAISRGITKGGVAVNMLNLEVVSPDEVAKAVNESNGFVIGSPTLGGHMPTQVQVALGSIIREKGAKELPCGVFGSFGWSGEAVDEMEQRLKDAGFKFAFQPIRVKFRPTVNDLNTCTDSGREVAVAVKRKLKAKEASMAAGDTRVAMASAPTLAMGRVVGSLAVITAKVEDAAGAMLASWISQASFDPPGITVSVKKDRSMEPLMYVGGKFAVSMVPEGAEKVVMRRLAKSFQPGEDRLAGLETTPGEVTGAPVLNAANAVLECQVSSRMEAGDHWVVYATVLGGKVIKEDSPTAVHHRKVGNHY